MLYLCYLCRFKPLRDHLRGFLIAAWAGDKIAEFSFPEISFHFPLRPWFFFVSPAYAGKSANDADNMDLQLGSPPRMRGKVRSASRSALRIGITPACAGKRAAHSFQAVPPWDHPRMCGEKHTKGLTRPRGGGSPPHVRGKVDVLPKIDTLIGITPACAGKRPSRSKSPARTPDHPRMCGEKCISRVR